MELNGAKILFTIHTNIPILGDLKITQTLVSTRFVERDSVSDANGSDTIQYGAAMGSS